MNLGKGWITFLLFSLICLIASVYLVFFHDITVKRPEEEMPIVVEETHHEEGNHEQINGNQENNDYIQTGLSPESGIYVREIPVPLEPEMQDHLAQFRSKAKLLNREYPDSFMISMKGPEKTIALTFDDGPDNSSTPKIVEILDYYKIKGTFFLLGQQMVKYPDIVELIHKGGHAIANHSWSHIRPTDVNLNALISEIEKTQQEIAGYNVDMKLFRPPYGLVDLTQMPALKDAGYTVVSWSIDSMDWYFDDPRLIADCVVKNVHPGAIVLMHSSGGRDNREATIEALPEIIETLLDEGYSFVRLGE